jgi:NADPH:quinone reductase-like Zn-dependent oxidoreductase
MGRAAGCRLLGGRGVSRSAWRRRSGSRRSLVTCGLEDQALAEVASGRITPLVNEPFPRAEAAQAHAALENRATVGEVVLKP